MLSLHLFSHCVYNGSSVNAVDIVNVNLKNFIITFLWGMMNVLHQILFLWSLNYFF